MTLPVLVFDLDGTLSDPREGIVRCLLHALAESGVAPPAGDLTRFIGPPLLDSLTELTGSAEGGAAALAAYRRCYTGGGMLENVPYEGIDHALAALADRAPALFVATSKPHVYAEAIVDHFGMSRFFRGVYGPELSGERAGKAELLAWLLAREALAPSDVVMIGDREHDILAARANGTRSVGVSWGFGSVAELRAAGADVICDTAAELVRWYERLA